MDGPHDINKFHYYINNVITTFSYSHVFLYVCGCASAIAHMWMSENNLQKSALSFHHVSPRSTSLSASTFTS